MKSKSILYTPNYGVTPILKYIPKDWIVWCPCETDKSKWKQSNTFSYI